jgi:hypothetical protein
LEHWDDPGKSSSDTYGHRPYILRILLYLSIARCCDFIHLFYFICYWSPYYICAAITTTTLSYYYYYPLLLLLLPSLTTTTLFYRSRCLEAKSYLHYFLLSPPLRLPSISRILLALRIIRANRNYYYPTYRSLAARRHSHHRICITHCASPLHFVYN